MTESMGSFKLINESNSDTTTSKYIVQPVEKRIKNPSSIWKYYGIARKENESSLNSQITNGKSKYKNSTDDRIICLWCFNKEKVQLYKKSTSSGNLWRHLNRVHSITIPKCINTAVNIRSEILSSFSEENDESIEPKNEPNVNIKNDSKFSAHDIDGFKDIGSLLIEEISKYPLLYENHGCDNLTEKHCDKLWNEIYENLGKILDIKRLQQMWTNIRDRYIKIRNFEKNAHIDDTNCGDTSTNYKYYNRLKFLDSELLNYDLDTEIDNFSDSISIDEPIEKKPRINDIVAEIDMDKDIEEYIITEIPISQPLNLNEASDTDSLQRLCVNIDDNINKYDLNKSLSYNNHSFDDQNDQIQDNNFKIITTSNISCSESEQTTFTAVNLKRIENFENINNQNQNENNTKTYDELDLFGRFVAEKMRNIPKSKWDNLQIKILQILRNEQN